MPPLTADVFLQQAHAHTAKAMEAAKATNDAAMKEDALAREKGSTPAQIEARKRVAGLFCGTHFPKDTPAAREGRLAPIDFTQPLFGVNERTIDPNKSTGFLGMGRKPAYLVSEAYPPKKPDDPIYALQYVPLKR